MTNTKFAAKEMKKHNVELKIVNNHFFDNELFFYYNGKVFQDVLALAIELGAKYCDLDSELWRKNVKFTFEGNEISAEEVFDER